MSFTTCLLGGYHIRGHRQSAKDASGAAGYCKLGNVTHSQQVLPHVQHHDQAWAFDLLHRRTLVFMGDSITQHIFKNLICTLAIAAKPLDFDMDALGRSVRVRYRDTELELLAGGNPQLWGNTTRNLSLALPSVVSRLKPGDIAIINAGVHWNGEEQIRQEVGALATAMTTAQRSSRGLRLLWLETPPQHFPTTTGLYEPLRNDGTNPMLSMGRCAILNTSTSHFKPQANLRNIVAEDALPQPTSESSVCRYMSTTVAPLTAHTGPAPSLKDWAMLC